MASRHNGFTGPGAKLEASAFGVTECFWRSLEEAHSGLRTVGIFFLCRKKLRKAGKPIGDLRIPEVRRRGSVGMGAH